MNRSTLTKANELQEKIDNHKHLMEHFHRFNEHPNNDPRKEVQELLNGYDNLMSSLNRNEIARIMLDAFQEKIKKELEDAIIEFEEL